MVVYQMDVSDLDLNREAQFMLARSERAIRLVP